MVILNLLLWNYGYAQEVSDTVDFKSLEVVAQKIPKSYKTTVFDSLAKQQSENLADLVNNNSSVFIKSYGISSLASISFRGTGASHTKVLWNGTTLNSPMNGQIDFSLYPTLFFDDAELHYGASGLIDGSGALGGSVVLNNQEEFKRQTKTSFSQSIASFDNYVSALKIKTGNNRWFYETQLFGKTSKNNFKYTNIFSNESNVREQMKNAQTNQYGLQQAIYHKLKNGTIGARVWYFNSERQLPSSMANSSPATEKQDDESIRVLIELKGLKNKLQYQVSSALISDQLIYENKTANIYSKSRSYLYDNNINTFIYLNYKFKLTNNLNIRYETVNADGYEKQYQQLQTSWLLGLNKSFKKLSLDLFNRIVFAGEKHKSSAPGFGVQYKVLNKEDLFIKANMGINYHYPTFNDLYWNPGGNDQLQPELAKMIEGGLNYSKSAKKLALNTEVTAFYSFIEDWIIWLPTEFGFWSPSNLKEVENKGIETSLRVSRKSSKWKLQGIVNHSYNISTNLKAKNDFDNSIGKQLIYVPYHKLSSSLQLSIKSVNIAYSYNYTGQRFMTSDNNWYLPAHFISDIAISNRFTLNENFDLSGSFKVKNILNQDYQSIAYRPMPGRNYLLSIIINFKK